MSSVRIVVDFDDINFACQRCGACCHHRRPRDFPDLISSETIPQFVEQSNLIYLTAADVKAISREAGLKPEEFVDTLYPDKNGSVRVTDGGRKVVLDLPVMSSKDDTTCVFYREDGGKGGCRIYGLRPKACRLFPFRVEETTTASGDMLLKISYNPTCPGIGKGQPVDKSWLEQLVVSQFMERAKEVTPRVQKLAAAGKISPQARVYRTFPGRR